MKRYLTGLTTGILLALALFLFLGAGPAADDSVKYYIDRLETVLKEEIARNQANGRYQLQSLAIDRTHWHYLLDTTTGELYRLEAGRTPEGSRWVLQAGARFER